LFEMEKVRFEVAVGTSAPVLALEKSPNHDLSSKSRIKSQVATE
jgi:hypothetical protein